MFDQDFIARFEAKISKSDGCWEWIASLAGAGYGQMKLPRQRRQEYSHRLAYMIYKGPIGKNQFVCHACDNTKCCNPEHLFLGTQKENLQDMKVKNRHLCGEKNSQAKLSDDEIRQIRACITSGVSQAKLAKAFGVAPMTISRIKRGERWSHVK